MTSSTDNLSLNENYLRETWLNEKINGYISEKLSNLEEEYNSSFPEMDETGNKIEYIETDKASIEYDFNGKGKIVPEYPDTCYEVNDDGTLTLKDECKDKQLKLDFNIYEELMSEIIRNETFNVVNFNNNVDLVKEYIEYIKPILLDKLNKGVDLLLSILTKKFPEHEIASWPRQEEEARAYKADPNASTPLIDGIAKERGIDKEILVDKIIEKAYEYAQATGVIFGKRQKVEDLINSMTTLEDIDNICKFKDEFEAFKASLEAEA